MESKLNYYKFELTRVIDGDTICGTIDLGLSVSLTKQNIRLIGINTPEIRGLESEDGIAAKSFVVDVLTDSEIIIHCEKRDSFGRALASVYYTSPKTQDWVCLNTQLLDEGLAQVYEK